jgi:hypothetical protein
MPLVAEAWLAGEIDDAHVRRFGRALNRRTEDAFAMSEAFLVDKARCLTFREFEELLDYWLAHADPDGADEEGMEKRARRAVSLDETFTGMWSGHILLDPVSGAVVSDELRRLEQKMFEADWAEARARLGREPSPSELARTPDQRRADALVEMAVRSATAKGKRPRLTLSILMGASKFSELCQLSTGQVVTPASLVPWITEMEIERILFDAYGERAVRVSRRRLFTGAVRRIIEVRDRRCYHDYCEEPMSRCQADHVEPWSEGGMTSQENGRLACGFHNRIRNGRPPPGEEAA